MIEVEISNTQSQLKVDLQEFAAYVRRILKLEGIERASVSIALVDDVTIHEINRQFLQHDWPTDVISFVLSEPEDPVFSGELVISTERAFLVAAEAGIDPLAEFTLYFIHGLLHLCGYDDGSAWDISAMRRREAEIFAELGIVHTFPPTAQEETVDRGGRG